MVEQSAKVNLLPVDTEIPVRFENTFLLYPEGAFFVDVFECKGNAEIVHGMKEEEL